MIVQCIKNKLANFGEGVLKHSLRKVIHLDDHEDVGIKVGQLYKVYGINLNFFIENMPFYYICEDEHSSYPVPIAAVFFEIIDSKPSKYWNFVFEPGLTGRFGFFLPEWARDQRYYERLVDGGQKEEDTFVQYKKLIEDENIQN